MLTLYFIQNFVTFSGSFMRKRLIRSIVKGLIISSGMHLFGNSDQQILYLFQALRLKSDNYG